MEGCAHPAEQQVRTVYYVLCGACQRVRLVSYCNYAKDCHPECALAPVCAQPARAKFHAAVPVRIEPGLE